MREKDSWSSDVYFAWKAERLRLRSGLIVPSPFASTSAMSAALCVPATDNGVSPPHTLGVSSRPLTLPAPGTLNAVEAAPFFLLPGPGVITPTSVRPASRIHFLSPLSTAFRYSRWASVSASPGKKSRRMMCDMALVYVSSSSTMAGRLIRFGAGGGGMREPGAGRLARDVDVDGAEAGASDVGRSEEVMVGV